MKAAKIKSIPWFSTIDFHMREVVKGTLVAFVMKAAGVGLSFTFNVLLARLLGASGTGIYFLALTITTIASVVGRMGLDSTLIRYTAAHAVQNDWDKVEGTYRKGLSIAIIASTVIALALFFGARQIAFGLFSEPNLQQPLRIMTLSILPVSLIVLHTALLKGLKKIQYAMLLQGFGVPLLGIPLLLLIATPYGVLGAVLAYVIASILIALLGIHLWRRSTRQLGSQRESFRVSSRTLLNSSLPLLWVASMQLVMKWTDTFMLGIWTDSQTVGIYSVAIKTAMLIRFILEAVNSIAVPKFAALYAQNEVDTLGILARNTAKLLTLLVFPIVTLFMLMPSWILGIFGPDFTGGSAALIILSVGQFVNVITGSVGHLLIVSGHEKLVRNIFSGTAMLNVVLNAVLIPQLGITGAAIATAISLALTNLIAAVVVFRKLSIMTLPIPKWMLPIHG